MSKDYKYSLEKYRPGGSTKYTCPYCGQKKCFTRFINNETGEYLDESCGKCDHENSCSRVIYTPSDYFRDHPELKSDKTWEPQVINGHVSVLSHSAPISLPEPEVQSEFFDIEWAKNSSRRPSTFRTWIESLGYGQELTQKVLSEYYVGATKPFMFTFNGYNGAAAIFWQIDEQHHVHDGKIIAYQTNGHRIPNCKGSWIRFVCEKNKVGPLIKSTDKVFFGLHLLPLYPDKTVYIVESEKSALVCALRYPEHLWIATGGCGYLTIPRLKPLMDRKLVLIPDSGQYEKWCKVMQSSRHKHYEVQDMIEQYEPNTDIADVILGEAKLKSNNNTESI